MNREKMMSRMETAAEYARNAAETKRELVLLKQRGDSDTRLGVVERRNYLAFCDNRMREALREAASIATSLRAAREADEHDDQSNWPADFKADSMDRIGR